MAPTGIMSANVDASHVFSSKMQQNIHVAPIKMSQTSHLANTIQQTLAKLGQPINNTIQNQKSLAPSAAGASPYKIQRPSATPNQTQAAIEDYKVDRQPLAYIITDKSTHGIAGSRDTYSPVPVSLPQSASLNHQASIR